MTEPQDVQAALQHRQRVMEMARAFRVSQILFTCIELGVFDAIAGGARTDEEIAAAINATPRGAARLLGAATALGLVEKRQNGFVNTPMAETCLTRGGSAYVGDSLKLESAFRRRWEHLTAAIRTGQRPEENVRDEKAEDWVRNFEHALFDMASPVAPFVASALALPQNRPLRVLDVGGGHGAYSIALARRYPQLKATIFELPCVVPVAREIIAQAGLSDRVFVQEGDFQRDELGSGYDVALVFGVLNGEPPEGRPALISKVFRALDPGGFIVLRDLVLNADRTGPLEAMIFDLQMLLATDAGGLDTAEEWTRWLVAAGFAPPRAIALPVWIGPPLIVAEKPAAG